MNKLFRGQGDFLNAFSQGVENSNRVLGWCAVQNGRARAFVEVVNVADLGMRILNVLYREADRLGGLLSEAENRNGKCGRHQRMIGSGASFQEGVRYVSFIGWAGVRL